MPTKRRTSRSAPPCGRARSSKLAATVPSAASRRTRAAQSFHRPGHARLLFQPPHDVAPRAGRGRIRCTVGSQVSSCARTRLSIFLPHFSRLLDASADARAAGAEGDARLSCRLRWNYQTGCCPRACILWLFSVATISRPRYMSDADTVACYIGSRSSASVGWRTVTIGSQERGSLLACQLINRHRQLELTFPTSYE
jgi:hypothetical protein